MTAAPEILVVGALHYDVVVRAPRLPGLDETLAGSGVDYVFGGKGGNQAMAAARHGAAVAMAGCVGDDAPGRFLLDHLDAAEIDRQRVRVLAGAASGMSAAIVTAAGDYGAVIVSGANALTKAEAIAWPSSARMLLIQNEIPAAENQAIAERARAAGAAVLLNAAPARPLSTALLEAVDILIVNRLEAATLASRQITTRQDAVAIAADLAANRRAAIITLGADGLVVAEGGAAPCHHPGHAVEVVSTHGAGDAFVGALAARLVMGGELDAAADYAQMAAALHVAHPLDQRATIGPGEVWPRFDRSRRLAGSDDHSR